VNDWEAIEPKLSNMRKDYSVMRNDIFTSLIYFLYISFLNQPLNL
jgi:hypothetical protein